MNDPFDSIKQWLIDTDPNRNMQPVNQVLDADTLDVGGQRVRLKGIDAPEMNQPYGAEARSTASGLVDAGGGVAAVESQGEDNYGRTLGEIQLPGTPDMQEKLLAEGAAWWYRNYDGDPWKKAAESKAKKERKGLWNSPLPTPPWAWRGLTPEERSMAVISANILARAEKSLGTRNDLDTDDPEVVFARARALYAPTSYAKLLENAGEWLTKNKPTKDQIAAAEAFLEVKRQDAQQMARDAELNEMGFAQRSVEAFARHKAELAPFAPLGPIQEVANWLGGVNKYEGVGGAAGIEGEVSPAEAHKLSEYLDHSFQQGGADFGREMGFLVQRGLSMVGVLDDEKVDTRMRKSRRKRQAFDHRFKRDFDKNTAYFADLMRNTAKEVAKFGTAKVTGGGMTFVKVESALSTANDTYVTALDAGLDKRQAAFVAGASGAITYGVMNTFDKIFGGRFAGAQQVLKETSMDTAKKITQNIPMYMLRDLGSEMVEELIDESLQSALAKVTYNPEMSLKEFTDSLADTAANTFATMGVLSGSNMANLRSQVNAFDKMNEQGTAFMEEMETPTDIAVRWFDGDLEQLTFWVDQIRDDPSRNNFRSVFGEKTDNYFRSRSVREAFLDKMERAEDLLKNVRDRTGGDPAIFAKLLKELGTDTPKNPQTGEPLNLNTLIEDVARRQHIRGMDQDEAIASVLEDIIPSAPEAPDMVDGGAKLDMDRFPPGTDPLGRVTKKAKTKGTKRKLLLDKDPAAKLEGVKKGIPGVMSSSTKRAVHQTLLDVVDEYVDRVGRPEALRTREDFHDEMLQEAQDRMSELNEDPSLITPNHIKQYIREYGLGDIDRSPLEAALLQESKDKDRPKAHGLALDIMSITEQREKEGLPSLEDDEGRDIETLTAYAHALYIRAQQPENKDNKALQEFAEKIAPHIFADAAPMQEVGWYTLEGDKAEGYVVQPPGKKKRRWKKPWRSRARKPKHRMHTWDVMNSKGEPLEIPGLREGDNGQMFFKFMVEPKEVAVDEKALPQEDPADHLLDPKAKPRKSQYKALAKRVLEVLKNGRGSLDALEKSKVAKWTALARQDPEWRKKLAQAIADIKTQETGKEHFIQVTKEEAKAPRQRTRDIEGTKHGIGLDYDQLAEMMGVDKDYLYAPTIQDYVNAFPQGVSKGKLGPMTVGADPHAEPGKMTRAERIQNFMEGRKVSQEYAQKKREEEERNREQAAEVRGVQRDPNIDQFGNDLRTREGKLQSEIDAGRIEDFSKAVATTGKWSIFVDPSGPTERDLVKWNHHKHVADVLGYEIGEYTFNPNSGNITAPIKRKKKGPRIKGGKVVRDPRKKRRGRKGHAFQRDEGGDPVGATVADHMVDQYGKGELDPNKDPVPVSLSGLNADIDEHFMPEGVYHLTSSEMKEITNAENAEGFYDSARHAVLLDSKVAGDFAIKLHEAAHSWDVEMDIVKNMPQEVKNAIGQLDYSPTQARPVEGFAEFLMLEAITGGDWSNANENFSRLRDDVISPWFEQFLKDQKNDFPQRFKYIQKRVQQYMQADPMERILGAYEKTRVQWVKEAVKNRVQWFSKWLHRLGLRDAAVMAYMDEFRNKKTGLMDPGTYQLLVINRGRAADLGWEAVVAGPRPVHMLDHKTQGWQGISMKKVIRDNLKGDTIAERDKDHTNAMAYIHVKSALTRQEQDPNYIIPFAQKDVQALLASISPEDKVRYDRIAKGLTQFANDLLEVLRRVGYYDQAKVDEIKRYPDYLPFFHTHESSESVHLAALGLGGVQPQARKAPIERVKTGAWGTLLPPDIALAKLAVKVYSTATAHSVMRGIAERFDPDYGGVTGQGNHLMSIERGKALTEVNVQAAVGALGRLARKLKNESLKNNLRNWQKVWNDPVNQARGDWEALGVPDPFSALNVIATEMPTDSIDRHIITIKLETEDDDGNPIIKNQSYMVSSELWEALHFSAGAGFNRAIALIFESKVLGKAIDNFNAMWAKMLRTIATVGSVPFAGRNIVKDWEGFQFTAKDLSAMDGLQKPFYFAGQAAMYTWLQQRYGEDIATEKVHPLVAQYIQQMGGRQQTRIGYGENPRRIDRELRAELGLLDVDLKTLLTPTQALRNASKLARRIGNIFSNVGDMLGTSDMGPRLAEAEAYLKSRGYKYEYENGKWSMKDKHGNEVEHLPDNDFIGAAWAAGNATTNFLQGGALTRSLNRWLPFINSTIQGTYKNFEVTRQAVRGERPWKRMVASTLISIIAELSYLISLGDEEWMDEIGSSTHDWYYFSRNIRLPKAHNAVFSNSVNLIYQGLTGNEDWTSIKNKTKSLIEKTVFPPTANPFWQGLFQQHSNWDSYFNRPVVSNKLAGLEAWAQYDENTTTMAKVIAKILALGQESDSPWASPARVDHFINKVFAGLPREPWKMVDIRRAFWTPSTYSQSVGDFYDAYAATDKRIKTLKHVADKDDKAPVDPQLLKDFARLNNFRMVMSDMFKVMRDEEELSKEDEAAIREVIAGTARTAMGRRTEDHETIFTTDHPLLLPVKRKFRSRLFKEARRGGGDLNRRAKAAASRELLLSGAGD